MDLLNPKDPPYPLEETQLGFELLGGQESCKSEKFPAGWPLRIVDDQRNFGC